MSKRQRREQVRNQRRVRQFIDILAKDQDDIAELREVRPPDVAIQQVQTVPEDEVYVTDSVTQELVTDTVMTWGSDAWGETEWGTPNVG